MTNKIKIILACLIGSMGGIVISTLISISISLGIGDGNYYSVTPDLVNSCGSEINAVILQTICSVLYGATWAGAAFIWKNDNWSILRQTITHLVICSAATFPIAYLTQWMPHTLFGVLTYFGIFFAIYFIIWMVWYLFTKKSVRQMNDRIHGNN